MGVGGWGWGVLICLGRGLCSPSKEVSGSATVNLGQVQEAWRPLMQTMVNLTQISSIKSTFQFRTFDPEGVIFYGDTKNGLDWFILGLKGGFPLMQISKVDMLVSVAGGPRLNDGKWHTLEVSNHGQFVILDVDGSQGLVVGLRSKQTDEDLMGELRLALGGILINTDKMIVQFRPQMDGCVREGSWLNLTIPWETEADQIWPCYENIKPGSFFPGTGFAIFNASVFPTDTDQGIQIEFWGDFSQMDGTICSIKPDGQDVMFALVANNNTKEVTLTFGPDKLIMTESFSRLMVTFQTDALTVLHDGSEAARIAISPMSSPGYWSMWREGTLAIGGLLGEDDVGSQFLSGCLEKIQIQGKDLDLDLSTKHMLMSSHSCPV
uniref:Sex hormone-binding globulin n=1 Tax=Sphaeramia orbicularis TaxID=375764 RepID=A0A673CVN5_9TELE